MIDNYLSRVTSVKVFLDEISRKVFLDDLQTFTPHRNEYFLDSKRGNSAASLRTTPEDIAKKGDKMMGVWIALQDVNEEKTNVSKFEDMCFENKRRMFLNLKTCVLKLK